MSFSFTVPFPTASPIAFEIYMFYAGEHSCSESPVPVSHSSKLIEF